MHHKILTAASLAAIAGTISGCNSSDSVHSQGPWGPAQVCRNYPEYSAPWGRHYVGPPQYAVGKPIMRPADVVEIDVVRPARRQEVYLEPDIGPAVSTLTAEAAISAEPPIRTAPIPEAPERPSHVTGPATAAEQSSPPGVFTPPQRASSYAGGWTARIGASSCKVQLSTVPSLDLYKASTQGCNQDAMRSVNGWSFRENQVVLFSRGQPVARLSGAEAALTGTLNSSGSDIRMSR